MEGSAIVQLEAVIKRKTKTHQKKTKTKSTYTDTLDGPVGPLGRDQPIHHNGRPLPSVFGSKLPRIQKIRCFRFWRFKRSRLRTGRLHLQRSKGLDIQTDLV